MEPQKRQIGFADLVMPHLEVVYKVAHRLTGDPHEAEDLAQETFLRASNAFSRFELREMGPKPWLLGILHNVYCSRLERRRREPVLADLGEIRQGSPVNVTAIRSSGSRTDIDWEQFDDEVKDAVEALAPENRTVLLLWGLADLKYREIAHVLGCALGTVMSRLHRARRELSQKLSEYAARRGIRVELTAA